MTTPDQPQMTHYVGDSCEGGHRPQTVEEAREAVDDAARLWGAGCYYDGDHKKDCSCEADYRAALAALEQAIREDERRRWLDEPSFPGEALAERERRRA